MWLDTCNYTDFYFTRNYKLDTVRKYMHKKDIDNIDILQSVYDL